MKIYLLELFNRNTGLLVGTITLLMIWYCSYIIRTDHINAELKCIVLGDWGWFEQNDQKLVAQAMAKWAVKNSPGFVLTVGDNIYGGIESVHDEAWERRWKSVYNNHKGLTGLPWFVSVGNGDYENEEYGIQKMVDYAKLNTQWTIPHLWYSFYKNASNQIVHFIVIDTEVWVKELSGHESQIKWLKQELSRSKGDYIIVVGHRPLFSTGNVGPYSKPLMSTLLPLLEKYEIDIYLSGHDHNFQHIQSAANEKGKVIDYIISGGGGAFMMPYNKDNWEALNRTLNMKVKYFKMTFGFAALTVNSAGIAIDFLNEEGKNIYSYFKYTNKAKD